MSGPKNSVGHPTVPSQGERNADKNVDDAPETDRSSVLEVSWIEDLVTERFSHLRRCYEDALELDPTLEGTLTVQFTIEDSGAVKDESASGMKNLLLEGCVLSIFGDMTFPKLESKEQLAVRYPLVFNREGLIH